MVREGCNERMVVLFEENFCNSEDKQAVVNGKNVYYIKTKKGQNPLVTEFACTINREHKSILMSFNYNNQQICCRSSTCILSKWQQASCWARTYSLSSWPWYSLTLRVPSCQDLFGLFWSWLLHCPSCRFLGEILKCQDHLTSMWRLSCF